jgi:hypothetical protein
MKICHNFASGGAVQLSAVSDIVQLDSAKPDMKFCQSFISGLALSS